MAKGNVKTHGLLAEAAIMKLRQCQSNFDIEAAHIDADGILTDLLTALGYQDVVAEWEKVDKWYA